LTRLKDAFVKAGVRRFESEAGLGRLGVPLDRQDYHDLPDGVLAEYREKLDDVHAGLIERIEPDDIYTTGFDGYDGHTDHIEVHNSILRVVRRLGAAGIGIHALNSRHEGTLIVPATYHKLGAMACHVSQQAVDDLLYWSGTDLYTPLIRDAETYDVLAL